jgi:transposase
MNLHSQEISKKSLKASVLFQKKEKRLKIPMF